MKTTFASLLWLLLGSSCSEGKQPKAADTHEAADPHEAPAHADEAEHKSLPTRVRLDPAVLAAAKIKTAAVTREVLAATIDLPGELTTDPDKTAKLSPLVAGRIEAVRFKEGQSVKQGDVLALIKVPELGKAMAAFAASSARAAPARTNAERLQALSEKRLAANQEVLAARSEADALEVEATAAREQLKALGSGTRVGSQLVLRAPISGVVIARDAIVGQPVSADQTIATIADLDEVWFLGRVFEKNLGQIQLGAPAEVELNAYPSERFVGAIEYLGKQIDPTARTVVARVRLQNRGGLLRLGLFGVARVGTGEEAKKKPVLVVPRSAVTEIASKPSVFVRQPDGDFDLHEVVLGEAALGKVEVVNGLREGEQAVVEGVFTLKSAVLKSTFGEDE